MPYVDDIIDETVTEDVWQDAEYGRHVAPVSPVPAEGRITGFFNSLVASMALLRRSTRPTYRPLSASSAADILAQNYPHLYIRVMCG